MELSKQEMELFLPLLCLWSKNFFYKIFLICSEGFQTNFQKRKCKYPNRKWNNFSHFQASDQKTFFFKMFLIRPIFVYLGLSWPILTYLDLSSPIFTYDRFWPILIYFDLSRPILTYFDRSDLSWPIMTCLTYVNLSWNIMTYLVIFRPTRELRSLCIIMLVSYLYVCNKSYSQLRLYDQF